MSDRIVLGISGYVGSGKSSVAEYFIQNNGFRRVSFADKIREIMVVLGVPMEVLRDPVLKERPHPALCGKSPREAMETLGTKWAREMMHQDFWLNQFILASANKNLIIVDDVRFQNEVETIKRMGGHIFRLRVPGTQPRVGTDFEVDKLTGVEDITNIIGETKLKHLYQYFYGRTFNTIPSDLAFEEWKKAA